MVCGDLGHAHSATDLIVYSFESRVSSCAQISGLRTLKGRARGPDQILKL
jgi:hypothetical protein